MVLLVLIESEKVFEPVPFFISGPSFQTRAFSEIGAFLGLPPHHPFSDPPQKNPYKTYQNHPKSVLCHPKNLPIQPSKTPCANFRHQPCKTAFFSPPAVPLSLCRPIPFRSALQALLPPDPGEISPGEASQALGFFGGSWISIAEITVNKLDQVSLVH